jgi:GNAT superfamily N-acetyltransferase
MTLRCRMQPTPTIEFHFIPQEERHLLIPIFRRIHPTLPEKELELILLEMYTLGYQCMAVLDGYEVIGVAGIWISSRLYVGKYLEYDHLFLLPQYRHQGIGTALIDFVNDYAQSQSCKAVELSCDIAYPENKAFWKKMGFRVIGQRFQKRLLP